MSEHIGHQEQTKQEERDITCLPINDAIMMLAKAIAITYYKSESCYQLLTPEQKAEANGRILGAYEEENRELNYFEKIVRRTIEEYCLPNTAEPTAKTSTD